MATLGNVPAEAYTNTVKDSFSGNGSTTAFTMSLPTVTNDVRVVVENVIQDPTVAYSVSGTTLTFTSAPPSGTNNVYVVHLGPAVMTTVPPAEIADATTFASSLTVQGAFTSKGIDDNADAVALTIDSNEGVNIGKTSAALGSVGLQLSSTGYSAITTNHNTDTEAPLRLNRLNGDGALLKVFKDSSEVGNLSAIGGRLNIISNNGSSGGGLRLDSAIRPLDRLGAVTDGATDLGASAARFKDAYLSGGVYLGGTGAANKLDNYEIGSWTPVDGSGQVTITSATGVYTRVGRQVTVLAAFTYPSTSQTNYAIIAGLPFAVSNSADAMYAAGSIQTSYISSTNRHLAPLAYKNNSHFYFYDSELPLTNAAFSSKNFRINITYFTDD